MAGFYSSVGVANVRLRRSEVFSLFARHPNFMGACGSYRVLRKALAPLLTNFGREYPTYSLKDARLDVVRWQLFVAPFRARRYSLESVMSIARALPYSCPQCHSTVLLAPDVCVCDICLEVGSDLLWLTRQDHLQTPLQKCVRCLRLKPWCRKITIGPAPHDLRFKGVFCGDCRRSADPIVRRISAAAQASKAVLTLERKLHDLRRAKNDR